MPWAILPLLITGALDKIINALFHTNFSFWYMFFDGIFTVTTTFVSTLDLSALVFVQYAQWSNLPPQAIYLINQLALPQCASIIAGSILIRALLNLLPAAVTRV